MTLSGLALALEFVMWRAVGLRAICNNSSMDRKPTTCAYFASRAVTGCNPHFNRAAAIHVDRVVTVQIIHQIGSVFHGHRAIRNDHDKCPVSLMAQKGSLVGALSDAAIISGVAVRRVITVINELSAQDLWFIDVLIKYALAIIDQRMAGTDHIIAILQCQFGIVLAREPPNGCRSIALDAERREVLGIVVHDARSGQSGISSAIDIHGIAAALIKKSIKLSFVVLVHAAVGLRDHLGGRDVERIQLRQRLFVVEMAGATDWPDLVVKTCTPVVLAPPWV